jgi:hypothetical protein
VAWRRKQRRNGWRRNEKAGENGGGKWRGGVSVVAKTRISAAAQKWREINQSTA